jgi:hypothetical protein
MLHAQSPPRREAASPVPPRCSSSKKVVTPPDLQLHSQNAFTIGDLQLKKVSCSFRDKLTVAGAAALTCLERVDRLVIQAPLAASSTNLRFRGVY